MQALSHHGTPMRRDLGIAAIAIAAAVVLSVHFELSEAVHAWARPWERYQLDEFPGIALFSALILAWFVWRRIREVQQELGRRLAAERALAAALDENRRMSASAVRMQEAERRRLARELHDELGQRLNAIKIEALAIRRAIADGAEDVRRSADSIASASDHLHAIVRDMTRALRPAGLDELGLAAALEHHVGTWRETSRIDAAVEVKGDIDALAEEVNITVYRLVQEALTNVSRHADARTVRICIERSAVNALHVRLSDDGQGADAPWAGAGVGLIGMRERVEALGGTLRVETAPERGFELSADLPLERVAA